MISSDIGDWVVAQYLVIVWTELKKKTIFTLNNLVQLNVPLFYVLGKNGIEKKGDSKT